MPRLWHGVQDACIGMPDKEETMQITSFNPVVVTADPEGAIKLFEDLGFVRRHAKDGLDGREDIMGVRMKHESGFYVDIATTKNVKQDSLVIRMNVRDFDEAKELLEDHGFKSVIAAPVTDSSSKSISMISPSGFTIALVEHIRK